MSSYLTGMNNRTKPGKNGWNHQVHDFKKGMNVMYLPLQHQKLNNPGFRSYGVVAKIEPKKDRVWVLFASRNESQAVSPGLLKPI